MRKKPDGDQNDSNGNGDSGSNSDGGQNDSNGNGDSYSKGCDIFNLAISC